MGTQSDAREGFLQSFASDFFDMMKEMASLDRVTVKGYKSICDELSIGFRPLTILAGANSSGKSSIMQPLLLLKQTLEATYDPGALKLDGPHVRFTTAEQLLSHRGHEHGGRGVFRVGLSMGGGSQIVSYFENRSGSGLDVYQTMVIWGDGRLTTKQGMSSKEFEKQLPKDLAQVFEQLPQSVQGKFSWQVTRDRCFLRPVLRYSGRKERTEEDAKEEPPTAITKLGFVQQLLPPWVLVGLAQESLEKLIHLPGLRGNPERTYPVSGVGETFPGLFQSYVASIIAKWEADENEEALSSLSRDLEILGLSWKIATERVSDAEVEIRVGRLPPSSSREAADLVSIADVGFGVSQALPVVVALRVATHKNLVYIEQPEIHLHPRAQVAMARLLADAVKRGVRIVAETHSPLLLLAIQTLVAQGDLSPDLVRLHWFTRSKTTGVTKIRSADLDDAGAFGDWPEDFGTVEAEIENRYLSAAEAKLLKK
jgi:predicted ATPase